MHSYLLGNVFDSLQSLLVQVHAIDSTIRSVQGDVEAVYGKYAPFQFLAYWYDLQAFSPPLYSTPVFLVK